MCVFISGDHRALGVPEGALFNSALCGSLRITKIMGCIGRIIAVGRLVRRITSVCNEDKLHADCRPRRLMSSPRVLMQLFIYIAIISWNLIAVQIFF